MALAGAAFVAADAMADHVVSGSPGTYHHPRPAIIVVPAAAFALIAWLKRSQFSSGGRVGLTLCLLGAAANAASLMTNQSGVSDYLNIQLSHYLITFNAADVAMGVGLMLILGSIAARKLTVRPSPPAPPAPSAIPSHAPAADEVRPTSFDEEAYLAGLEKVAGQFLAIVPRWGDHDQEPVGIGARRPRLHAAGQWLADHVLAGDDPGVARHGLGHERRVRLRALALGVGIRPLVGMASRRVEVAQAQEAKRRANQDVAQDVVDKIVEDTQVDPA